MKERVAAGHWESEAPLDRRLESALLAREKATPHDMAGITIFEHATQEAGRDYDRGKLALGGLRVSVDLGDRADRIAGTGDDANQEAC